MKTKYSYVVIRRNKIYAFDIGGVAVVKRKMLKNASRLLETDIVLLPLFQNMIRTLESVAKVPFRMLRE